MTCQALAGSMGTELLLSWGGFGALVVLVVIVAFVAVRRYRRWTPTRGSSPESKQAEARLWSTRGMDQR